jgi:hypothetical protein
MKTKITAKLTALGQTVDDVLLTFLITLTEQEVLDFINRTTMPDTLEPLLISVITGRYLIEMDGWGKLTGIDFKQTIKALSEGDLSIAYNEQSVFADPELIFKTYIKDMGKLPKGQLIRYRRVAW